MFFGIRDLPYLKAGIWDFNENWRRDSGLKVRDAENNHWDYGIARKLGSG